MMNEKISLSYTDIVDIGQGRIWCALLHLVRILMEMSQHHNIMAFHYSKYELIQNTIVMANEVAVRKHR